jgi:hypothetical protein
MLAAAAACFTAGMAALLGRYVWEPSVVSACGRCPVLVASCRRHPHRERLTSSNAAACNLRKNALTPDVKFEP